MTDSAETMRINKFATKSKDGIWSAGIDLRESIRCWHYNAIECNAISREEAIARRDAVFAALSASGTKSDGGARFIDGYFTDQYATGAKPPVGPSDPIPSQPDETAEDGSFSGITWHSNDGDGGPDVGVSIYLGTEGRLWFGEISRSLFKEHNGGEHFADDSGWFLVHFGKDETKLIAKVANRHEATEFAGWLASLMKAHAAEQVKAEREACAAIRARGQV